MTNAATPAIQPNSFHLGLSSEWLVNAVSDNIRSLLEVEPELALGQPITTLLSNDVIHEIRNRMALLRSEDAIEHLFQFNLGGSERSYDLALYRCGSGFGIDVEPCEERSAGDSTGILSGMLSRVKTSDDIGQLCDQACGQLRALTGFQQVSISTGQVQLGQSMRTGGELISPSASIESDMVVFDRDADPVAIHVIDKNWSSLLMTLPSPSLAEVDRLRKMPARAALVVPLHRDGQVWGQVACYHGSPRHVSAQRRNIARLFANIMSLRIEIAELRRGS